MRIILAVFTLLVISGCNIPLPEADSEVVATYTAKCGVCHPPVHPKKLTKREWKSILKVMEKKVELTGVREPLSEEERASILAYLTRHSRAARGF